MFSSHKKVVMFHHVSTRKLKIPPLCVTAALKHLSDDSHGGLDLRQKMMRRRLKGFPDEPDIFRLNEQGFNLMSVEV